ncbi:hypothetical protein CYMTET_44354 [Cymbomonas tetramitiformis]|uniref:Uncharacterized protein n=1 Tax=Cymbomonas tetramitiformis TaxID=36881 RepID=A0AAE0C0G9_9CHLO|nr:hypothetical protein CYMTET_44354 [Cymbomonas tetramitiformis]|eukprot:gene148-269_t
MNDNASSAPFLAPAAFTCERFGALVADARHVPSRWHGLYERTGEITLKDVIRGPYPNAYINRVQFRYHLPANPCAASRALLSQLKESNVRKRARVHLFQIREDANSEYYLGAHVVLSGNHRYVVLHLLAEQSECAHIRRKHYASPGRDLAELIVRSVVPADHEVRSDIFDAVHGVRASPANGRSYREIVQESGVGDVLSANVGRCQRITWRAVFTDDCSSPDDRFHRIRDQCRSLRDVCMQRVVLIQIDKKGAITFRDFGGREEAERDHVARDSLTAALFHEND